MSGIDEKLREELSALLDDALPEERAAELRRRLEEDEALRREYESLRLAVQAVRALPREPAPLVLQENVWRELRPRGGGSILRWAVPLAAAATVLVAATLLLRGDDPSGTQIAEETPVPQRQEDFVEKSEKDGFAGKEGLADEAPAAPSPGKRKAEPKSEAEEVAPAEESALHLRESARDDLAAEARGAKAQELSLFARVEAGRVLAVQERPVYLAQLQKLERDVLGKHLAKVAGERPPAVPDRPLLASVAAVSEDEARLFEGVLRRHFPVRRVEAKGADVADAGARLRRQDDGLEVSVEGTEEELRQLLQWLRRLGVAEQASTTLGRATPEPAGEAGAGAAGENKRDATRRVEIVITFPKKEEQK